MTRNSRISTLWQWVFLVAVLVVFTLPARAAVPDNVDYQGYLSDSSGSPINGTLSISFNLYNVDTGGIALWSDTHSVVVNNGLFSVKLGTAGNPFPLGLFDAPLWLGIDVAGDGEMAPRVAMGSSAFAHKADDAHTLEGQSASSLDQSAHVSDISNPHAVTAAQVGAPSSADLSLHTANASAHHAKYTDAEAVTAMGVLDNTNPLHHNRRSGGQVFGAVLSRDGAGSTLDADLLDGADSSAFATSTHTHTGSSIISHVLYPSACYSAYCPTCPAAFGWCPDGVKTQFVIEDVVVTDFPVISFNVIETLISNLPYNCEVTLVRDGAGLSKIDPTLGEIHIRCESAPTSNARLHYAVINP